MLEERRYQAEEMTSGRGDGHNDGTMSSTIGAMRTPLRLSKVLGYEHVSHPMVLWGESLCLVLTSYSICGALEAHGHITSTMKSPICIVDSVILRKMPLFFFMIVGNMCHLFLDPSPLNLATPAHPATHGVVQAHGKAPPCPGSCYISPARAVELMGKARQLLAL